MLPISHFFHIIRQPECEGGGVWHNKWLADVTQLLALAVRHRLNRSKVSVKSPQLATGSVLQTVGKVLLSTSVDVWRTGPKQSNSDGLQ